MKKITIIGGGNLGSSLAKGLANSFGREMDLVVTGRNEKRLISLQHEGITTSIDNRSAIENAGIVILCVLPQQIDEVLEEIRDTLSNQTVVSTATGVSIDDIKNFTGKHVPVVRAMPNTAASIGKSMTCICSNDLNAEKLEPVSEIFKAIGDTMIIDEQLMQAATVLGASGIAFFLRYIRAATQGGIQMGFHPHEAQKIAVQTAIGAASLVKENAQHPELEIDRVTTPRGCTIEGLNEMEHQGLSSAVIRGLMTSYNKINDIR